VVDEGKLGREQIRPAGEADHARPVAGNVDRGARPDPEPVRRRAVQGDLIRPLGAAAGGEAGRATESSRPAVADDEQGQAASIPVRTGLHRGERPQDRPDVCDAWNRPDRLLAADRELARGAHQVVDPPRGHPDVEAILPGVSGDPGRCAAMGGQQGQREQARGRNAGPGKPCATRAAAERAAQQPARPQGVPHPSSCLPDSASRPS
jgi:hypothetical protein